MQYPFPVTTLTAAPVGNSFPSGSNLLTVTPAGTVEQTPVSLLPNQPLYRAVTNFGAKGDGITDDTAAVASCFATAPEGTTIVFPPGGTFLITRPIAIVADRIRIIGIGSRIISNAPGQDRKFAVSGRKGVEFHYLTIDGGGYTFLPKTYVFDTYSPRTHPGTLHFVDCVKGKVFNCDIQGVNWPVTLLGSCDNIHISECVFAGYYAAIYGYFSGDTGPSPKRVKIRDNHFKAGKFPTVPLAPSGSPRSTAVDDVWCSGAIKFRGTPTDAQEFSYTGHVISGNTIVEAGQMGIELQGVNDSAVSDNNITSCTLGISLSFARRISVENNTIKDAIYTCIEVDGRNDGVFIDVSSTDAISLTGNTLDGRDEYGRPVDWVNNYGIVLSNVSLNVSVTGGAIKYCKTAIAVTSHTNKLLITGVKIVTNEQSDYGGIGGFDTSQGILLKGVFDVDINGCKLEPVQNSWQRMINILESSGVRIRGCTITSNNCPVYIHNSSNVLVENCLLKMGAAPVPGSAGTSFVGVDSREDVCEVIRIRGNTMVGAVTYGISLYSPANHISDVLITDNDTSLASCGAASFLTRSVSGTGSISGLKVFGNHGSGDASPQTNLGVPVYLLTGTIMDLPEYETILAEWTCVVNLQTAVGYNGKIKRVICVSPFSTVTLRPQSGEKISGNAGDLVMNTQWDKRTLLSDGANWHLI